jgi:hypothetical protein
MVKNLKKQKIEGAVAFLFVLFFLSIVFLLTKCSIESYYRTQKLKDDYKTHECKDRIKSVIEEGW